ncbi:hypothetical protein EDB86DRAFT_1463836 [Lactarius hatsudake]|nr:hypothetical protein EDB86DRAFT_1463836 [Lactarius hatsudake]
MIGPFGRTCRFSMMRAYSKRRRAALRVSACQLRLGATCGTHGMACVAPRHELSIHLLPRFLSKTNRSVQWLCQYHVALWAKSDGVAEQSPNAHAPYLDSAPAPSGHGSPPNFVVEKRQQNTSVATWRFPEEIYASTLPLWRAASGVNASRWLSENARPSPSSSVGHVLFAHVHIPFSYSSLRFSSSDTTI